MKHLLAQAPSAEELSGYLKTIGLDIHRFEELYDNTGAAA